MNKRDIEAIIELSVADLVYYDCKNNEEREHGDIQDAINNGEFTISDMVNIYEETLDKYLESKQ